MDPIISVVMLATVVELVIEAMKPTLEQLCEWLGWTPGKLYPFLSAALGLLFAVAFQADLLAVVGLISPSWLPWLGMATTGLFIGRGANFVHNVIALIAQLGAGRLQPVMVASQWEEVGADTRTTQWYELEGQSGTVGE